MDDILALSQLGIFQPEEDNIQSINSSLSSVTIHDYDSISGMLQRERTDSMVSVGEKDVSFPTLENQTENTTFQKMAVSRLVISLLI